MYTITNYIKEILDWKALYFGIKNDIVEPELAVRYASDILDTQTDSPDPMIIDLLILDSISKENVLKRLKAIIGDDSFLSNQKNSKRLLRFCILYDMHKKLSESDLLSAVESLYEDFDYPREMEDFISYMPSKDTSRDPSAHTHEENQHYMYLKFEDFLLNEHKWATTLNSQS